VAILSFPAFSSLLLETGDLDPMYYGMRGVPPEYLNQWALAYACWYSPGVASYACALRPDEFWATMRRAATNATPTPYGSRWPRASERRHARGKAAEEMVRQLEDRYPDPAGFVDYIRADTAEKVMRRVMEHHLFGRWIGFKMADIVERVFGEHVTFDHATIFMFDSPREGARLVRAARLGTADQEKLTTEELDEEVENVLGLYPGVRAPPTFDRALGIQEVETMFCKWKSHLNNHYPVGNDIREAREHLQLWLPFAPVAGMVLQALPEEVLL